MDRKAQRGRLMFAGAAAAVLFGALASVGAALSPSGPAAAAKQYPKGKVTICHHTHSKKHPFVTIRISKRALKAHLKHGDTIGPCATSKKKKGKKGQHAQGKGHGKGKPEKNGKKNQNNKTEKGKSQNKPANGNAPNENKGKPAETHGKKK